MSTTVRRLSSVLLLPLFYTCRSDGRRRKLGSTASLFLSENILLSLIRLETMGTEQVVFQGGILDSVSAAHFSCWTKTRSHNSWQTIRVEVMSRRLCSGSLHYSPHTVDCLRTNNCFFFYKRQSLKTRCRGKLTAIGNVLVSSQRKICSVNKLTPLKMPCQILKELFVCVTLCIFGLPGCSTDQCLQIQIRWANICGYILTDEFV